MKTKRKLAATRVWQTVFYLMGFPLMLLLILKDSVPFLLSDVFSDTALNGICIALAIWLAVVLAQLALKLTVKSRRVRTIVASALAIVLLVVPFVIFDAVEGEKLEKLAEEQAPNGVTVNAYDKQAQRFVMLSDTNSYTDDLVDDVNRFIRVYNLQEFEREAYRDTTIVGVKATQDEYGVWRTPNGMLYDGYIFSVNFAIDQLITYHEFQNRTFGTETAPLTVDEALELAVAKAEASSEWISYSTSDEYLANEAEADRFRLTEDRLDEILQALMTELKNNADLQKVLSIAGSFIPDEYKGLLDLISEDVTLQDVCDALAGLIASMDAAPDLLADEWSDIPDEEELQAWYDAKQSAEAFKETLAGFGITDTSTGDSIKAGIMNLLSKYSFYQHPENEPIYHFFLEEDKALGLDVYAEVKYNCTTFGLVSGTVLIGDTIGNGTAASEGFTLTELYQLRTDLSYMPRLYPVFKTRRYAFVFAPIVVLSIYLCAHFTEKHEELLESIAEGGYIYG